MQFIPSFMKNSPNGSTGRKIEQSQMQIKFSSISPIFIIPISKHDFLKFNIESVELIGKFEVSNLNLTKTTLLNINISKIKSQRSDLLIEELNIAEFFCIDSIASNLSIIDYPSESHNTTDYSFNLDFGKCDIFVSHYRINIIEKLMSMILAENITQNNKEYFIFFSRIYLYKTSFLSI